MPSSPSSQHGLDPVVTTEYTEHTEKGHGVWDLHQSRTALSRSYNPSIHDDLIAADAASRFGISASEATNIYIKVDAN